MRERLIRYVTRIVLDEMSKPHGSFQGLYDQREKLSAQVGAIAGDRVDARRTA